MTKPSASGCFTLCLRFGPRTKFIRLLDEAGWHVRAG